MKKLSLQDIKAVNELDILDDRKDYLQNLVIREWVNNPRGILTAFTSFGKSYAIAKVIKILNKNPDATTCIVVPTIDLKEDMMEKIAQFSLKNVDVFVVNSLAKMLVESGINKKYSLFICDELHTLCNKHSEFFSQVIPRIEYKYFFGVSATLEKEHIEYLKEHELEIFFNIPLEDGYRANIVPEYVIYNVPVRLNDTEKKKYFEIQKEYLNIVDLFSRASFKPIEAINACIGSKNKKKFYNEEWKYPKEHAEAIAELLEKETGVVIYLALKWQRLMTARKQLLNNCYWSIQLTAQLAQKINEPALIVCSSIDVATIIQKLLPLSALYHSMLGAKERKENKRQFESGELKYLLVVKGLKQGYNNDKLRILIRQGYTSKALDLTQYLGRLLRPDKDNPDKFAILINFYVDDFFYNGKVVESQQKKWLKSALYKRSFTEWVNTIEDVNF